ncbi:hypothetical protein DL765_003729 [Monosporascus sp. GIB2]|nr:hypothetical protein DL765_003729 [Monosporascus sp. GIB2]
MPLRAPVIMLAAYNAWLILVLNPGRPGSQFQYCCSSSFFGSMDAVRNSRMARVFSFPWGAAPIAASTVGLAIALNSLDAPSRLGLGILDLGRGPTTRQRDYCELLKSELDSVTILPSDPEYRAVNELGCCIAQPRNTEDVRSLVRILTAKNTPFAIRSWGHSPNPFDANIDGVVLISLDNLDEITYDEGKQLVSLGPGGRWGTVYTSLEQYGVTMVGGRRTSIVTKVTWPTLPFKDGWGGVQTFALDQMPRVLQALHDYQTAPDKDLHANLIINFGATNDTILTLIYMDPVERPAAFAPFFELTPTFDSTGFYTLREITTTFVIPPVPRWTWYTNSFKPTPEFYGKLSEILTTAPEVATLKALQGGTLLATFQPINENLVLEGEKHGGNALGLEPVNQTWLALDVAWWNEADDDVAYDATEALLAKINKEAKADGAFLDYIFINDASDRQPVLASYGSENVQKLRNVQRAYDPAGIFQKLVPGGQKIPRH